MHIVTLGGGTGQATLLRGLCQQACQVTAIVGVTDNGGHSGQLRQALALPQVGDTRQCLSAVCQASSLWETLLSHRFQGGDLHGMSVGNLILAALAQHSGSLHSAVRAVAQAAGLVHRVLPVSDGVADIAAQLQDGQVIVGEWQIMQRQPCTTITRLFLQPAIVAHPAVLDAIAQADLLVLCPGSLLTGIVAVLLPEGIRDALRASQAPCVYVCNLMTQPGQTDGYTTRQHLATLHYYLGRAVNTIVVNNGPLPPALLQVYAQHGSYPVYNDCTAADAGLYMADLVEAPDAATLRVYTRPQGTGMQVGLHLIRHDAQKLATHIMAIATT
jgi:uncharacterized cofD-like protein